MTLHRRDMGNYILVSGVNRRRFGVVELVTLMHQLEKAFLRSFCHGNLERLVKEL